MYDYLVVGAGLTGSCYAYLLSKIGYKVLVIDKRSCVGGNLHCECINGILVHSYGAHIFHTNNDDVYNFITSFSKPKDFINSPKAFYKGKLYSLPFNLNTFYEVYGFVNPREVEKFCSSLRYSDKNLEEKAISFVGKKMYNILIKGYTEKQWGISCKNLDGSIISRLPVRNVFDNNYFNSKHQCVFNYNEVINNLLKDCDVITNSDYFSNRDFYDNCSKRIIYTGKIDEYFDYKYGELEYRTCNFKHEFYDCCNYQGNAVINYTERKVPYTRTIEHKFFDKHSECFDKPFTVVSYEYPSKYTRTSEPLYTIQNEKNINLYQKYKKDAQNENKTVFVGRLAEYKYYDMDNVIFNALEDFKELDKWKI